AQRCARVPARGAAPPGYERAVAGALRPRADSGACMNSGAVLVTGGNSGIGLACARALAREGWRLLIASRDRAASAEAVQRIVRESGNDGVSALELDLGSIASVRRLAG